MQRTALRAAADADGVRQHLTFAEGLLRMNASRRVLALSLFAILLPVTLDAQPKVKSGHVSGAGSVRIFYELVGNGPDTVVFVHGTPSTMYSLARDFVGLGDRFTLLFFDQRGGGRSQLVLSADSLTWQDHVRDIEALRDQLHISRFHLFGVSWGSMLAARYAAQYPQRVNRVVLFPMRARSNPDIPAEPGPLAPPIAAATQRQADSLIAEWPTAADPRAICEEYWRLQRPAFFEDTSHARAMRGSFCEEPPEILRHSWQVSAARMRSLGTYDLRPELRRIETPTLVVKGTRTSMYHAWTEEWVLALPNSRMLWIDNTGLLPWIDKPNQVFSALRAFYAGNWPTEAKRVGR